MKIVKEGFRRAMKAFTVPIAPFDACAPPAVPGKFVEPVAPATRTSPVVGWIAIARAKSGPPPPMYVAWMSVVREALTRATKLSLAGHSKRHPTPGKVGRAPPAVPGK